MECSFKEEEEFELLPCHEQEVSLKKKYNGIDIFHICGFSKDL
jgi:hypothetical protein